MNSAYQTCPICQKPVEINPSFPEWICNSCTKKATDALGEHVIFYHSKLNGKGYQGYYRRNKELIPFTGNSCYIHGVKCYAMYDKLGGIVLQPNYETIDLRNPNARAAPVKQMVAEAQ